MKRCLQITGELFSCYVEKLRIRLLIFQRKKFFLLPFSSSLSSTLLLPFASTTAMMTDPVICLNLSLDFWIPLLKFFLLSPCFTWTVVLVHKGRPIFPLVFYNKKVYHLVELPRSLLCIDTCPVSLFNARNPFSFPPSPHKLTNSDARKAKIRSYDASANSSVQYRHCLSEVEMQKMYLFCIALALKSLFSITDQIATTSSTHCQLPPRSLGETRSLWEVKDSLTLLWLLMSLHPEMFRVSKRKKHNKQKPALKNYKKKEKLFQIWIFVW